MSGEAAGDANRSQLVIKPTIFSSGHAPTLSGGPDDPRRPSRQSGLRTERPRM